MRQPAASVTIRRKPDCVKVEIMLLNLAETVTNSPGVRDAKLALRTGGSRSLAVLLTTMPRCVPSMLAGMREAFFATPAFFWLATPGNSRELQIAAGRAWVRAHLAATALGLSVQPISQTLQEYPEMTDHRARIHAALAQDGEVLQMLGRLGYGPGAGPAPRWPLETRMLNG